MGRSREHRRRRGNNIDEQDIEDGEAILDGIEKASAAFAFFKIAIGYGDVDDYVEVGGVCLEESCPMICEHCAPICTACCAKACDKCSCCSCCSCCKAGEGEDFCSWMLRIVDAILAVLLFAPVGIVVCLPSALLLGLAKWLPGSIDRGIRYRRPRRRPPVSDARLRGLSTSWPRRRRETRLRGICTSRPRRRRDSSPRNMQVVAAAAPRDPSPRNMHVVAAAAPRDPSPRNIHVAATRLHGISTS